MSLYQRSPSVTYAAALAAVAVATAARVALDPTLGNLLPYGLYLVVLVFVARWSRTGPSIVFLLLGWWCGSFFFLSPRHEWLPRAFTAHDLLEMGLYLFIGAAIIAAFHQARGRKTTPSAIDDRQLAAAHLAAIVESSDDAIISKNLDSIITSWNAGAERLFGYTPQEAIGKPITMLMPPERFDEEPEILARIKRGQGVDHYETVRRRKDGRHVNISLTISPLRDAHGTIVGASKIVRDITESIKAQQALRESEAQARSALAAAESAARIKDEFLAMLSHELRTPMTAILGWARMLRTETDPAETKQGIEVIERNARLQAQIIEDLLDMSRIVSGKFRLEIQSVNVAVALQAAVEAVRHAAAAKNVQVSLVCDAALGDIRGDPSRLQQVFFNLISNAVKFNARGGSVRVAAKRRASHVEVTVDDSGRGIKAEFLPRVFDRFQQQDGRISRQYQGLGLGLAIVKHLVELHGGTVHATSDGEGKGATFTVELPVSVSTTASPSPTGACHVAEATFGSGGITLASSANERPLRGTTVLVTDDEPDARDIIRRMLERQGAKVMLCGSATDTLDRLQRHRPDVLVCDIGMPEVDGYALIGRVRALSPDRGGATPAIALTAFASSEDRDRALLAGFQLHLPKPVESEALVASIQKVAPLN